MLSNRYLMRPKMSVLLLLMTLAIDYSMSQAAQAFAPKAMGVVTIDVSPDDNNNPSAAATTQSNSTLQLAVDIHSRVDISELQLTLSFNPSLTLRQGQTAWQGAIAAGQTIRLHYSFDQPANAGEIRGECCRFNLFRLEAGLEQWLSAASYRVAAQDSLTQVTRVPLEQLNAGKNLRQSSGGGDAAQRYVIEYSLD